MQTGIGNTQNKWWQTYLSTGMATAPHPAQIIPNGCIVEKDCFSTVKIFIKKFLTFCIHLDTIITNKNNKGEYMKDVGTGRNQLWSFENGNSRNKRVFKVV